MVWALPVKGCCRADAIWAHGCSSLCIMISVMYMNKQKIAVLSIIVMVFLMGAAVFFYPTISDYINRKHSSKAIIEYNEKVEQLDKNQIEKELEDAREYNKDLYEHTVVLTDPFDPNAFPITDEQYEEVLNLDEVMAYVEIQCIDVYLPIYHGTDEKTLAKGVGHLENTSLPVGGVDTHPVLSAHCGLPNARLFTDLCNVHEGNIFKIHVLGETLTYRVYDIEITEPDISSTLYVTEGKDLATLITCTPYGENTHRLLVHGERINESEAEEAAKEEPKADTTMTWEDWSQIAAAALTVIFIISLTILLVKTRKKRR